MRALLSRFAPLAAASIVVCTAAPCRAQEEGAAETPAAGGVDRRIVMTDVELGYRGSFVPSAGYDPFSTNDALPQLSLGATRTLVARDALAFAAGLAWDYGSSSAFARGASTSLDVNRLTVPLEGRLHFGAWGYAFARVAPGVLVQHARVGEASAPSPLESTRAVFAADASLGYAWLAWRGGEPTARGARLWIKAEGGYGWAASARLDLAADGGGGATNGVDLGDLAVRGAFFRVGAAVGF